MPSWLPLVLCVEAALWAAFFAQLSHQRRRDRQIAGACGRVAGCLLVAATGFLILSWGFAPLTPQRERAARELRTALADPHAPLSFPATARDGVQGVDLLSGRSP